MKDLSISEMMQMQKELHGAHPEWGGVPPEAAPDQLLWAVGELGEVIQIVKKLGMEAVTHESVPRRHFTEEMGDVMMYLTDVLLCAGITPEQFSQVYRAKWERNLTRDYVGEHDHIFDGKE